MKVIENYINKALYLGGFNTKKNLAKYLDISPSAINQWIKEDNIPKRHLNKIQEAIDENIKNSSNYIKTVQTNNGHIVQGKSIIHGQPAQDPREKTLIDKFRTLSEIGKIEVENCINNIYLKELKENK